MVKKFSRPEAALVAVTAVWGSTFLTVQKGLSAAGPWSFVGLRFGTAALALAALSWRVLRGLTRRELAVGVAVGFALVVGYGLQTVGLQSIPSSTSAFLTALYVPVVPLAQWAVTRRAPHLAAWAGVACAFAGLLLLTGATISGVRLGPGEVATLLGTVGITAEIMLIGYFADTVDARRVAVVQLSVCALLAFAIRPLAGEPLPAPSWTLLSVVAALAVATAVIQVTMNWAQRSVSPTRATVIYAGEPVWAALLGRAAGERLPATSLAGGALVVLAVLISELRRPPRENRKHSEKPAVRGRARTDSPGRQRRTGYASAADRESPAHSPASRRRSREADSSVAAGRCGRG